MRTLKFRIWDKAEKKWMFGYDYENLGGFSLIGEVTLMGELSRISLEKLSNDDYAVMQYTGLKDKNGKEIYEGDVMEGNGYRGKSIGTIVYSGMSFVIKGIAEDGKQWFETVNSNIEHNFYDVEIIGNIYENPELLK